MLIALDYDDTFTADPDLWRQFVELAKSRGHQVVIATLRYREECDAEMRSELPQGVVVFPCERKWKRGVVEGHGLRVDVWIDDMPECIGPRTPRETQ